MHFRILALMALAVAMALPSAAQKGINNPMTRAVLQVYEKQLQENPTDWECWMARANEYYIHSEYLKSLNDIDNALKYIPADRKGDRFDALMLRANIYTESGRHAEALNDLNAALSVMPNNYVALYLRANTEYSLGNYAEASADYKRLQRLNPRSSEALVGLARVAVKENNLGTATRLLDDAVAMSPNDASIYVRRASVRKLMGQDRDAVDDLILALSLDSDNSRAVQDLVDYGKTHYSTVIAALTSAIQQAPNVAMYPYIRGVIAQANYKYKAAAADFRKIIDGDMYDYHGIWASLAECQFAMGQFKDALENIETAIRKDPLSASHMILKAQIMRAMGEPAKAFDIALKASVMNGGNMNGLLEMGLCQAAQGKWNDASVNFGEAYMEDSTSPELLMLRAWVLGDHLNQPVASQGFFQQVTELEGWDLDNVQSLKGFALLLQGKTDEARAWMNNILDTVTDNNGFISYMGCVFYTVAGDNARAIELAGKSMDLGFGNYYDWMLNTDGRCNLAALRDDLGFLQLVKQHSDLWADSLQ